MATGRITKTAVEGIKAPSGSRRAYLWDDRLKGFGVMITPAGARSYLVQYRIGGRGAPTRRYTIGRHGSPWTADKARERATDLLELVRKRIDPLEAERDRLTSAAEIKRVSEKLGFSTYADFFIRKHADAKKLRSAADIRAVFRRDLQPHFGVKPISEIKRSSVVECFDTISERGPAAANKAHSWLGKMFNFAVARGDIASSPMLGLEPPHANNKRERTLKDWELRCVWPATEDLDQPSTAFLQMLLLTGQRRSETAAMKWEEVDGAARTWFIPGIRTKNKRDHLVPLSPQAWAVLERLQPDTKQRKGLVFTTNRRSPISGFSKIKRRLDELTLKHIAKSKAASGELPLPLDRWTLHDLRRTLATGCQALGFPIEHTEAVLNHISGKRGGLAAIYQLHEYKDEKTAALNAWGRHVEALLSGRDEINVIPLGRTG